MSDLQNRPLDQVAPEAGSDQPDDAAGFDDHVAPNNKRNLMVLAGLVVLLAIGGLLYLWWAAGRVDGDLTEREERARQAIREFEANNPTTPEPITGSSLSTSTEEAAEVEPVIEDPVPLPGEVLVVNRVPGDDYGRLAIRHEDGSRTLLSRECLRVHIEAETGVCVTPGRGFANRYSTVIFDATAPHVTLKAYASPLPSRARVSPDGSIAAVTSFVTGASYEDIGGEASTIVTLDLVDTEGSGAITSLQQYEVVDSDEPRYEFGLTQYWGPTFRDAETFYVTGFYGEFPEIMIGKTSDRSLTPTGWVGSCPSLSPDGNTLVFKEMRAEGGFDLVAVNLDTNERWKINETRSVDDQVEWLDNDTILYALHPEDTDENVQPEFDIWMIDIAEGSEPVLFLPNADSPAVQR